MALIINFPITQMYYLVTCIIISIISTLFIGLSTTEGNTPLISLPVAVILFFITFLFLVTPYNLIQGVFSVRFGGRYQGMCNGRFLYKKN